MNQWYPDLKVIPILADAKPAESHGSRGTGSFFSCGVDACYTFLKHYEEITTGILIHGFDYQEKHVLIRNTVSSLANKAASKLNRPLIEVNTNIRTLGDLYANWGKQYHGSVLASVALLLSPQLGKVYIPSSYHRNDLFPWGSHPELDSLLSSDSIQVVHDSCDVTRSQKVSLVAQNDAALSVLRVCWSDYTKKGLAMNCGKCEKCIRTMVDLRIAGALDRCHTFRHPLRLKKVARVDMRHGSHRSFYQASLRNLKETGADPALEKALNDCLNGQYYQGIKGKYRDMRKKAYREVLRPMLRPIERSVRKLARKILPQD
ncbi:MAG: hypothetical protein QM703_23690 [Gemmatales bacterium]